MTVRLHRQAESPLDRAGYSSHNQAEIKAGIETFFMENFSGYVQVSSAWGGDDYRVLSGSVGLKLRW